MAVNRLSRKSVDQVVAGAERGPFGDVTHFCSGRFSAFSRVDSPLPPRAAVRDDGANTAAIEPASSVLLARIRRFLRLSSAFTVGVTYGGSEDVTVITRS